jgi:glycosyltransferase involved in cell wall biosynthesis
VMAHSSLKRVAVVTNIVAPYRTPVLRELAREVELRVFYSAQTESNRRWSLTPELPFDHEIVGGRTLAVRGRVIYLSPRLISRLWSFRPAAVIVGGFSLPTVYALLYCVMSGAKLIIVNEGTSHTERALGRASRLLRWGFVRAAKAYVVTSTEAHKRLCDLGAEPRRTVVVPYAIDLAHRPTRDYSLRDGPARLLYVGRFCPAKGVLQLLDAVADIEGDGVTLTMVGHGPLEVTLRDVIAARALGSRVSMRGFVDQPELPDLYAEHDLFAFPTLEDTFGIVLLEAMAAGLPVIASCFAGATHDFVEHEKSGWIIDPLSADGIVGALRHALDVRASWPQLGTVARQRLEQTPPRWAAHGLIRALDIAELPRAGSTMGGVTR